MDNNAVELNLFVLKSQGRTGTRGSHVHISLSLPPSPLVLQDLGALRILVGPVDTKELNQSLTGGDRQSGGGAGDRGAEQRQEMWWEAPQSRQGSSPWSVQASPLLPKLLNQLLN